MLSLQTCVAAALAAAAALLPSVQAHGYLLLPETKFTTDFKNYYAYVVPSTAVPPESSYWTGNAETNAANFKTNYATLNSSSLREFILANQVVSTEDQRPSGGTPECGFSIPDATAQPLPDHLEYGNYIKDIIHPGPCEVWCDDEIVVDFAEDCRIYNNTNIPYAEAKCQGKSRLTFYWLATHFAPFQVYISCVPLEGATSSSSSTTATTSTSTAASVAGEADTTTTTTSASDSAVSDGSESTADEATYASQESASDETAAPTSTTVAPVTTTATPVATTASSASSMCGVHRRTSSVN